MVISTMVDGGEQTVFSISNQRLGVWLLWGEGTNPDITQDETIDALVICGKCKSHHALAALSSRATAVALSTLWRVADGIP